MRVCLLIAGQVVSFYKEEKKTPHERPNKLSLQLCCLSKMETFKGHSMLYTLNETTISCATSLPHQLGLVYVVCTFHFSAGLI